MYFKSLIIICIIYGNIIPETIANDAPLTTPTPLIDASTLTPKGESESCAGICGKTYALHTYPKADHLSACLRGCRFYVLIDLVSGQSSNDTKNSCLSVCSAAYNESEYYACSIGCNNQVPFTRSRSSSNGIDNTDESSEESSSPFVSPFTMMRSLFQSVMNRGSVMVQRSSMAFYLTRNTDTGESKLVIVHSEPEVVVHQYHPELMQQRPQSQLTSDDNNNPLIGTEERTTSDYQNQHHPPRIDLSLWNNETPLFVNNRNNQINRIEERRDNPWVTCFSYQSGIPRWILALVLFLAIFVLAWICCTTITTAPEQHIRQRQIGLGSDLQYLRLFDEPVKVVITDTDKPPKYEDLQAGPLPAKEPLTLSVVEFVKQKEPNNGDDKDTDKI